MAKDRTRSVVKGGGCDGLHELARVHLHVAGDLESGGYTCIHQLQFDRESFAAFCQNIYCTITICRSQNPTTVYEGHH